MILNESSYSLKASLRFNPLTRMYLSPRSLLHFNSVQDTKITIGMSAQVRGDSLGVVKREEDKRARRNRIAVRKGPRHSISRPAVQKTDFYTARPRAKREALNGERSKFTLVTSPLISSSSSQTLRTSESNNKRHAV